MFGLIALPPAILGVVVAAVMTWIAFSLVGDPSGTVKPDTSPMSHWILENFRLFSVSCFLYFLAASVASISLLRQREWALTAWIVLLGSALLWSVSVVFSESVYFWRGASAGTADGKSLSRFSSLSALASIPVGLALMVVLTLLIRRFLAERRWTTRASRERAT